MSISAYLFTSGSYSSFREIQLADRIIFIVREGVIFRQVSSSKYFSK